MIFSFALLWLSVAPVVWLACHWFDINRYNMFGSWLSTDDHAHSSISPYLKLCTRGKELAHAFPYDTWESLKQENLGLDSVSLRFGYVLLWIRKLHMQILNGLPPPCEYIFILMNFVINDQELFQTNSAKRNVNTRDRDHLHTPVASLSCFQKSGYSAGIKIFNSLPSSSRSL
jgi:hypothetical protein